MRLVSRWIAVAAAAAAVSSATGASAQPRVDLQATELLRKMSDYLGGVKALSVQATFRQEVVLVTGQKLEFESWAQVTLRRPDRLRTSRHGTLENLDFFYDGKTTTIFRKEPNVYASAPAPASYDAMADNLRANFDIEVPGSDLLYADAYAGMIVDLTDALYVGLEDVGGVRAHHLAFRHPDVDWQIWVQEGEKPLPVKYVITTKWMTGAPSFDVVMTNWDLAPKVDDATFAFVPPPGAQRIEFRRPPDLPAASR